MKRLFCIFILLFSTNIFAFGSMTCDRYLDNRKSGIMNDEYKMIVNALKVGYFYGLGLGSTKIDVLKEFNKTGYHKTSLNQYLYLIDKECRNSPTSDVKDVALTLLTKEFVEWLEKNPQQKKNYNN